MANHVVHRARGLAKSGLRRALVPARRTATAAAGRVPVLGPWVGRWTWLWQPGWSRRQHERFYSDRPDPYGFDAKPGERTKYEETLGLLAGARFARALEIGASEGSFTELLATQCDAVVGTDISEVALGRARERFRQRPGVTFERRNLPFDFPAGTFDLIVCSDVLYLWEAEALEHGLTQFAQRLRPGGTLLLVHYLGDFGAPLSGGFVHDRATSRAADLGLDVRTSVDLDYRGPKGAGYRADVLVRAAR